MQHGINGEQWLQFVEGTLEPNGARRIEEHVRECHECDKVLDELKLWRESIILEGTRLRRATNLPEPDLDRMLEDAMCRIRLLEPEQIRHESGWTAQEGLMLLRALMQPFCGIRTAAATVDLAVRQSAAGGELRVSGRNWPVFVSNLSDALGSVCGLAAGRLIGRAGRQVPIEEG